jgi:creatinine amidohydrolase
MQDHGFSRFYVLNGHGGNSDSNRTVLRKAKADNPNHWFAHSTYFDLIHGVIEETLQGPSKRMTHGCEAETSLVMHLRPDLVRHNELRKGGLDFQPEVSGMINLFDEVTEAGFYGYPQFACAATGEKLFDAAVAAVEDQVSRFRGTPVALEIGE